MRYLVFQIAGYQFLERNTFLAFACCRIKELFRYFRERGIVLRFCSFRYLLILLVFLRDRCYLDAGILQNCVTQNGMCFQVLYVKQAAFKCGEGKSRIMCLSGRDSGGDEGIRTLDTSFGPYAPLAGECLRPLGHISGLLSIFNCSGMHDNSFSSAPGQWTSLCFLHFSHGCQNRISGVFSFFLFSGAFMLFRPVPVARSFLHDGV